MKASPEIENYYEMLQEKALKEYAMAGEARRVGLDPDTSVEIPLAKGIGDRVEGLVGPKGVAKDIDELLETMSREQVAIEIINGIIIGKYGEMNEQKKAEQSVRSSLTLLTEGVVAAPIEGIDSVEIESNPDGSRYLTVNFAGPIRSAGGTGQALGVLLADYTRKMLDLEEYRPTETEIERYVEEINIYHNVVSRLQYKPSDDEVRKIVKNCPICVSGTPTAKEEVNIYKNLERIPSNRIRGGMCLVIGEGIAQKAQRLVNYAKDFGLNWDWLHSIIKIEKPKAGKQEIKPKDKYLKDVVAGRPIIAYPSRKGAFRLRYGRARNVGLMSKGIHPATMVALDEFPAIGTQFKVERPGKGTAVVPCDSIEGPVVKLKDGRVLKLESSEQAQELKESIEEILFIGDLLVSFGDFIKDNHPVIQSPWTEEWWQKELEAAGGKCENPFKVSFREAEEYSLKHEIPLHPLYVFPYPDVTLEQMKQLVAWLEKGELGPGEEKRTLEELLVPHHVENGKVMIEEPYREALHKTLSIGTSSEIIGRVQATTSMELVSHLSPYQIKDKCPVYIGARMGRPEKAKERLMKPAPHLLFPVGNYGGAIRSLIKASDKGMLSVEIPRLKCPKCKKLVLSWKCPDCGTRAELDSICSRCGRPAEEKCEACGSNAISYDKRAVNLKDLMETAKKKVGWETTEIKGVKGTISANKTFEPIEKGILRSRNNIHVFKDGTLRFDSTNLVLTHFKPLEIGTTVDKLKELGYTKDKDGKPLENESQIVELFPQDVIPSRNAIPVFLNATRFLDEELKLLYGMEPYFRCESEEDLIGLMVIGLAPHTSAGVLGRVIGFSKAHACYAHPYFHAACRRDCFAYDESLPVFDGESWRIVKLGEFVEELLEKHEARKTEFGDLVIETNSYKTVSLDDTGMYSLKNITAFSKHPPQDHVVRLTAKTGRTIVTSGLHPFSAGPDKTPAFGTKQLFIPERINIPEKDQREIDLLEYADENTMIVGMKNRLKKCLDREGLKNDSEKLGMNKKTLFDYYRRDSVPIKVLEDLGITIPKRVKIKTRWDTKVIPRIIKVDEDFLRLLGFYVAEGHYRKKQGSFYQVSFALTKNKKRVAETIERVFGMKPNSEENSLTISSRLVYNLFDGIGCGRTAKQKRVPPLILGLPLKKVGWFLQGYFQGDGGISQPKGRGRSPEVSCTSANKMLLRDMEFLLTRFGITSSWQKDHRKMSTGLVAEKYRKKGVVLEWTCYKLRMHGKSAKDFCERIGFWFPDKKRKAEKIVGKHNFKPKRQFNENDSIIVPVEKIELIKKTQPLYNFTVEGTHNAIVSGITAKQCDGDEDSLMLLLDTLINFSKQYLPATRGGKMDACLVLTTVLDPSQVDDQVHRMDIVSSMPLEFYRKSGELLKPTDFQVEIVKDRLGTDRQYDCFGYTHETSLIDDGIIQSSYTKLETMEEKVNSQLQLGKMIRAVDEKDEAKRLLDSHFMPDIYGNLRAFGEQKFRCVKCNAKFRRVPLIGKCTYCGGKVILTIAQGSVRKYLEVSQRIAKEYDLPDYVLQRLDLVGNNIDSVFNNEKVRNPSLTEFM